MTEQQFAEKIKKIFQSRRDDLLKKLSRLDRRQKGGWIYRRRLRKGYTVSSYKVSSHYINVPCRGHR